MYQHRSGLLPCSFNNMFLVTRQVYSYGTRNLSILKMKQQQHDINLRRTRKKNPSPRWEKFGAFYLLQ